MASFFRGTTFFSTLVSSVLLVFLFVSSNNARELKINVKVTKGFVYQVCYQTRNPNLCVDVLSSDPRTEAADLFGLGSVSNNLAIINATDTQSFITNLLNSAVPEQQNHFTMCSLEYQIVIDNFKLAADRLQHSSYQEVNRLASDVISKVTACENVFQTPPVMQSPLTQRNKDMGDLADILVAISNLLS